MAALTDPDDDLGELPVDLRGIAVEGFVCVLTIAVYLSSLSWVGLSATSRLGQISGLASLCLRFLVFSVGYVLLLTRAARGDSFERTKRLVCASVAGLVSAMVAGGVLIALHGTPWGLNGMGGDVGTIATWVTRLQHGEPLQPLYPPLSLHILRLYSDIAHLPPAFAIKHLQILGVACMGPAAYLSWRLLLQPTWALAIGVVAMLPMIDAYKSYPNLVLVMFIPLALFFLREIRRCAGRTGRQLARIGIPLGLGFGVLCLLYSGWFQWSAPGLFIATLIVFPWKEGRRQGFILLGIVGAAFLVIAGHYIMGLFSPAAKVVDSFVYFDVKTDPMYVAMWRNDMPGDVGMWPPLGELGGVGLFTILLSIGFAAAVMLRRRSTVVIALGSTMAGAWFMKFWYAHNLWATKLVQLFPRTTPLILECLLLLSGFAIYWAHRRMRADGPLRGRHAFIGALCGLLLFFASAGSALSDRWMPDGSTPQGPGFLAYNAHATNRASKPKVMRARPMTWTRREGVSGSNAASP